MAKYVLSVDQSTQGTKALLFNEKGRLLSRSDISHRQIVNSLGWVSHDPEEIYNNLLKAVKQVCEKIGADPNEITCMGISNQRETSLAWNKNTGKPVCDAVVWQCARAADVCSKIEKTGIGETVLTHTGIPVSPYFPASKFAWILQNVQEASELAKKHQLCMGTIDTWLIWKLTGCYATDFSNASRTQLFNIHTLKWDEKICSAFGIDPTDLPDVMDSDAVFGETNLAGLLSHKIPLCGVLGDSHAALFGHGCLEKGTVKATYGTGSSIMMNTGNKPVDSAGTLVSSIAWKYNGKVSYVIEGNLNYTGAVITWLKDNLGIISSAAETESLAKSANPSDTTYIVPAFTGLGAPYWNSGAKAAIIGMTRLTGKAEIVRAALDCIAFQINDVVTVMDKYIRTAFDTSNLLPTLKVDGGPTRNQYLMQFQSSILGRGVMCPDTEELSGIGAAYMAGLSYGIYEEGIFDNISYRKYTNDMSEDSRKSKINGWKETVQMACNNKF